MYIKPSIINLGVLILISLLLFFFLQNIGGFRHNNSQGF